MTGYQSKSLKSVRSDSGKEAASGRQVAQAAAEARQSKSLEMLGAYPANIPHSWKTAELSQQAACQLQFLLLSSPI